MVERESLKERLRRQAAPATKEVMQVCCGYAGGVSNDVYFRLGTPVSADMRDGAAYDVVVRCRRRKWREFGKAVGHGVSCQIHVHDRYLELSKHPDHPISDYSNTVLVGPRRASISAFPSSFAKPAFSSGPRNVAIASFLPRDTRKSRSMPNSSSSTLSSWTQSGLSTHSRARPRWLTLRTLSVEGVTVTCSYAFACQ